MIVVSDTLAISALLTIHRADLLRDLFDEVLLPSAVVAELRRTHSSIPSYLREVPVTDQHRVTDLLVEVDRGEAEAIILAQERNADLLLLDEKLGRRVAQRAGLQVVGLLGVIATAKRAGLVPTVSEVVDQLVRDANFYISPSLRAQVLKAAQEQ